MLSQGQSPSPAASTLPVGAMGYQPGPAGAIFTGSGPGCISGAKHDFLYQFFALISNFLSGSPYLSGNDSFIKSSQKIHENLNLNSPDSSEQKKICSFFSNFYINFRFLYIFTIFHHFDPMEPCFDLTAG